jgi:hypothetical protein
MHTLHVRLFACVFTVITVPIVRRVCSVSRRRRRRRQTQHRAPLSLTVSAGTQCHTNTTSLSRMPGYHDCVHCWRRQHPRRSSCLTRSPLAMRRRCQAECCQIRLLLQTPVRCRERDHSCMQCKCATITNNKSATRRDNTYRARCDTHFCVELQCRLHVFSFAPLRRCQGAHVTKDNDTAHNMSPPSSPLLLDVLSLLKLDDSSSLLSASTPSL